MPTPPASVPPSYPLSKLCALVDLPPRTVRYYIQLGLVDRPEGETRAARYGARHLDQLLQIKKWTAAGLSLARIGELLSGAEPDIPPRRQQPGSVEVRSHLMVADGVDLVIEPDRAGLTPRQVRQFARAVMTAWAQLGDGAATNEKSTTDPGDSKKT